MTENLHRHVFISFYLVWCELSPQRSEDQWNRRWRVDTVTPWNRCLMTLMFLLKYWQSNETRLTLRFCQEIDYRITHLMWGMSKWALFIKNKVFIHFQMSCHCYICEWQVWVTTWGSLGLNDKLSVRSMIFMLHKEFQTLLTLHHLNVMSTFPLIYYMLI